MLILPPRSLPPFSGSRRRMLARGFTLLELMVVLSIVALGTAGVSLSMRDPDAAALERESLRLSALFESARAQSRASGVPVRWRRTANGFEFLGIAPRAQDADSLDRPRPWFHPDTQARVTHPPAATELVLGPEPLIMAQRIELALGRQRMVLGTEGLAPFAVQNDPSTP